MAGSQLFDNIMQVIHVRNIINGTTTVSTEIDLELPRGYVAKIRKIKMEVDDAGEKWGTGDTCGFSAALLLDPDDAVTNQFPDNEVEHDVIAEHNYDLVSSSTEFLMRGHENPQWIYFEDKEDVITARNMRWNTVATTVSYNDALHEATIYYTLEKIKDAQIMELLDIL